jgi:plasmid maintenance system killer protein
LVISWRRRATDWKLCEATWLTSIRSDDQWRIVFLWSDQGPEEVEIVDDH